MCALHISVDMEKLLVSFLLSIVLKLCDLLFPWLSFCENMSPKKKMMLKKINLSD
jgi:hypothetical protein